MAQRPESSGSAYSSAQVAKAYQLWQKYRKGQKRPTSDAELIRLMNPLMPENVHFTPAKAPPKKTPKPIKEASAAAKRAQDAARSKSLPPKPSVREASPATRKAQSIARIASPTSGAAASGAAAGGGTESFLQGSYAPSLGSINDYLGRASNAAGIEYDPQIDELIRQGNSAVGTQKASDAELKAMYAQLASSMKGSQAEEKTRFGQATAANTASYNQLANSIGSTFQQSANQQTDALKQLGIQAAAPDILQKSGEQSSRLQGLAKLQGQSMTDALNVVGQGAQNRMAEFSSIAGAEGAGRRADLQQLLMSKLGEWGGQIADLRGAKGKLINELSERYRNEDFDRSMSLANLQLNQDKFSAENEQWAKEFGLKSEIASANAAKGTGVGSQVQKLDAWQNLGLIADNIVQRQNPRDPARSEDYLAIIKRMFDDYGVDQITSAADAGKKARSLNSKDAIAAMNKNSKSKTKQVNSNFLNELAMDAYSRIIKGENYQYG